MLRKRVYQISEEDLFNLIERTFAIPGRASWQLHTGYGEVDSRGVLKTTIYITCEHESFEEVEEGNICPIVQATTHPPMF